MKKLNMLEVRLDGETQARVALDAERVTEYAEAMKDGAEFPPIVVFHDGSDYWLADGFHRYHAIKQNGRVSVDVEVVVGTVLDAQIFAYGANSKRGLSTSHEDNRSIIVRMLSHPISKDWTNAEIARHVGVSQMTVARVKAGMEKDEELKADSAKKRYTRKDGKEVTVDTAKLATKKAKAVAPTVDDDEQQKHKELVDALTALEQENIRLKEVIALAQWDASDIEKIDVHDTLDEYKKTIKNLRLENDALRESRDIFQAKNEELTGMVKSLQSKLKRMTA